MYAGVSGSRLRRAVYGLASLAALTLLVNAQRQAHFTPLEKAYYADPSAVLYVQPGFSISVVSARWPPTGPSVSTIK
jgi:hypothetical protein